MPILQFHFHFHNVNMNGDKSLQLKLEKKNCIYNIHIIIHHISTIFEIFLRRITTSQYNFGFGIVEIHSFFTDTLNGDHFKHHIFP